MKIVIQRVKEARVLVEDRVISSIHKGALLLVCLEKGDEEKDLKKIAHKINSLRYFQDQESGKMNQSLEQVQGEFLCVSQFTLSWNGQKGNRPSFDLSMAPELAEKKFDEFCQFLAELAPVKKGEFGASMSVELINDGPVTFSLNF